MWFEKFDLRSEKFIDLRSPFSNRKSDISEGEEEFRYVIWEVWFEKWNIV